MKMRVKKNAKDLIDKVKHGWVPDMDEYLGKEVDARRTQENTYMISGGWIMNGECLEHTPKFGVVCWVDGEKYTYLGEHPTTQTQYYCTHTDDGVYTGFVIKGCHPDRIAFSPPTVIKLTVNDKEVEISPETMEAIRKAL